MLEKQNVRLQSGRRIRSNPSTRRRRNPRRHSRHQIQQRCHRDTHRKLRCHLQECTGQGGRLSGGRIAFEPTATGPAAFDVVVARRRRWLSQQPSQRATAASASAFTAATSTAATATSSQFAAPSKQHQRLGRRRQLNAEPIVGILRRRTARHASDRPFAVHRPNHVVQLAEHSQRCANVGLGDLSQRQRFAANRSSTSATEQFEHN